MIHPKLFRSFLKNIDKKIAIGAVGIIFLTILSVPTYYLFFNKKTDIAPNIIQTQSADVVPVTTETNVEEPSPEQQKASEKITQAPPKYAAPKKKTTAVKTNTDGTKTTTVSDGDIGSAELAKVATLGPSGTLPSSVRFTDETGQFASLEGVIKTYLNEKLKWSGEISYLYNITVRDAGETGWEGQYAGSYQMDASGKIVSAYGYIILNVSYHKTDPHFTDYMKLVFSHEYGHHYTLYHKWVDLNLPAGVRFPDTYYSIRPLSKEATAVDYSKGWANCESEILAEDYSYFYSGYGFNAMSSNFGYPAPAVKTWIESLSQSSQSAPAAPTTVTTATDNPPTVSIASPTADSTISGTVLISANASDDVGVSKVEFYIDNNRIGEAASAPYQFSFSSASYSNGTHSLKAVAIDTKQQSAEKSINLNFSNNFADNEKPTITMERPIGNPYAWVSDESILPINIRTTDNIGVVRIKVYINNRLQINQTASALNLTWAYSSAPAGEYVIKVQAYDEAGNMGETSITINKS